MARFELDCWSFLEDGNFGIGRLFGEDAHPTYVCNSSTAWKKSDSHRGTTDRKTSWSDMGDNDEILGQSWRRMTLVPTVAPWLCEGILFPILQRSRFARRISKNRFYGSTTISRRHSI